MSFGKFIELEVYSTRMKTPATKLCEHTEENMDKLSRCFAHGDYVLKFTRSLTSAVLDLQIPWLQFEKSEKTNRTFSPLYADLGDVFQCKAPADRVASCEDVALLATEIMDWFGELKSHLTKVVSRYWRSYMSCYVT
jgi:hypothetical protein